MSGRSSIAINNFLQARNQAYLLSWVEATSGPSHAVTWTMTCKIGGQVLGSASSNQKTVAKEEAARQACVALGITA